MRPIALLLLLFTFAAHAQTVSDEHVYARGANPVSIAAPRGALVAWTDAGALHVQLVSRRGEPVWPATTIPTTSKAASPALATNGETFLIVFSEELSLAAVVVDANGTQLGPVHEYGTPSSNTPSVVWNVSAYLVWTPLALYAFDRNGIPAGSTPNAQRTTRVVGGNDRLLQFQFTSQQETSICWVPWACLKTPASYTISWTYATATQTTSGSESRNWYATGPPAATAGNDSDFVIAWNAPHGVEAELLRDGKGIATALVRTLTDPGTSPSVTFDGEHYVVTWEFAGDIFGALLRGDAPSQPFAIATGPRNESAPRITALGSERFLVTYTSDGDVVGRIVDLPINPGRRRAVR
ncbi:MAG: hypothetical protein M3Q69_08790 [Acidobacteriota bacterium]|nr:hypothetical protein [Acidobacteriota bacterium]